MLWHFVLKDHEELEQHSVVLDRANDVERDSLQEDNIPDPLANEQTWPTEEEVYFISLPLLFTFFFFLFFFFCLSILL